MVGEIFNASSCVTGHLHRPTDLQRCSRSLRVQTDAVLPFFSHAAVVDFSFEQSKRALSHARMELQHARMLRGHDGLRSNEIVA